MNALTILGIIIFLIWAYVLFLRPQLCRWFPVTFEKVNRAEAYLWDNSRTILFARLYWVVGIFMTLHDLIAAAGADWTPLVNEIVQFLPEKYRPLALAAFVFGSGILFEWLRRITTEPLEERKAAAFYSAPRPPGEG